jgi:hypothetical protein
MISPVRPKTEFTVLEPIAGLIQRNCPPDIARTCPSDPVRNENTPVVLLYWIGPVVERSESHIFVDTIPERVERFDWVIQ